MDQGSKPQMDHRNAKLQLLMSIYFGKFTSVTTKRTSAPPADLAAPRGGPFLAPLGPRAKPPAKTGLGLTPA